MLKRTLLLGMLIMVGHSGLLSQSQPSADVRDTLKTTLKEDGNKPRHGFTVRSGLKFKEGESPDGTDLGWAVGIGFDPPTENLAILIEMDYWHSPTLNQTPPGTADALRIAILASKRWSVEEFEITFCFGPGFGWGGPGGKSCVTFDVGVGGYYRLSDCLALGLVTRKQWMGRLSPGGGGFTYHPWLMEVAVHQSF